MSPRETLTLHESQFRKHPCSPVSARVERLKQLKAALLEREDEIRAALWTDFKKPGPEVDLTEITATLIELNHAIRHLKRWTKPRRKKTPIYLIGTTTDVAYFPKGPSLILAPWNYAILLTLGPVVHATAAGCPFVIKPSENTPRASELLKELIESVYPPEEAAVFLGGAEIATELLDLPFRHIHFTGNPRVGKIVMVAGAKHLSSVTLELGGKSPAYVDSSADLVESARAICFGKFSNSGQTCIAPDYVLVDESVQDELIENIKAEISRAYGSENVGEKVSRIIADAHFERQREMLDEALTGGATIIVGGELDAASRLVPPTVLKGVPPGAKLLTEEIFGPILPIVPVASMQEALNEILSRPPPLSTYVFSRSKDVARTFSSSVRTGAVCVNATLLQFVQPFGPFGGEGNSGIGRSHGEAGFKAFSNGQVLLRRRWGAWLLRPLQPPYGSQTSLLNRIFRWLT